MIVSKRVQFYFFVISVSILFILFGFLCIYDSFSLLNPQAEKKIKTAAEKNIFSGE